MSAAARFWRVLWTAAPATTPIRAGYHIGGKTGSSETLEDDHNHRLLPGLRPSGEDPQVVILLAYDNPKPTGPNSTTPPAAGTSAAA